jgi:hypothetical protein
MCVCAMRGGCVCVYGVGVWRGVNTNGGDSVQCLPRMSLFDKAAGPSHITLE